MAWFKRTTTDLEVPAEKRVRTEGLWIKCEGCRQVIWKKDLDANLNVCPKCERHFRINAEQRLDLLLDNAEYEVFDDDLMSTDPLHFTDTKKYSERLKKTQEATGMRDAILNARGKLNGKPVIISAMEYSFIGGSMG